MATSFPQWEYDLLNALGAPASQNNLTALNLWAQSEGSVTNNALATSGRGTGAANCVAQCGSSSPIYEYATEQDGVAQMARFLGGSYYTGIVHAFQADAGLAAIFSAINASPWCKGCQNGKYPEALAAAAGGGKATTSGTVGAGTAGGGGAGAGGAGTGTTVGAGLTQDCVFGFTIPNITGTVTFGLWNTGGQLCLLSKGGVKWLSGMAALLGGVAVGTFGVIMLAAYGYDASGAKQAVGRTTRAVGVPARWGAALAATGAGQPEAGAAIAASGRKRSSRSAAPRIAGIGPSAKGSTEKAGRRESRQIEERFAEAQRQGGPIGPRGGTGQRRPQRSVPGAGSRARRQPRRVDFEQRRRNLSAREREQVSSF